jgi:hypothetical protein
MFTFSLQQSPLKSAEHAILSTVSPTAGYGSSLGSANPSEYTITNAKLNILPSKHNAAGKAKRIVITKMFYYV